MHKKLLIVIGIIFLLIVGGYVFFMRNVTPTCDSKYAESQIINIYENQSRLYDNYKEFTDYITLDYPQATSYDKDIEKYSCKGIVTFHAKEDSEGFQYVNPWGNIDSDAKFSKIECPVSYSIVKSRDSYIVQSTLCGWADITYKEQAKSSKNENDDKNKLTKTQPIYEKIGVSKNCMEVWQIIQAEGYYSGEEQPNCSEEEMNKIYKYCENSEDCFEYIP